eukprot:TRINITY_DN25265_c0_g1_i1.p1 TRINITY_DN25265_c0_g1~~TRINITY_DN25265_c0_g1_i1.p1  ORF type:complete len:204 (+),score=10.74 TRINITY_DN25265_c0_g1_i1:55-612(+)
MLRNCRFLFNEAKIQPVVLDSLLRRTAEKQSKVGNITRQIKMVKQGRLDYEQASPKARGLLNSLDSSNPRNKSHIVENIRQSYVHSQVERKEQKLEKISRLRARTSKTTDIWFAPSEELLEQDRKQLRLASTANAKARKERERERQFARRQSQAHAPHPTALPRHFSRSHKNSPHWGQSGTKSYH